MSLFTEAQKEAVKAASEGDLDRLNEMLGGSDMVKDHSKFSTQLREKRWIDMDPHDRKSVDFLFVNTARGDHPETLQYMLDQYPYPRAALHDAIDGAIIHGSIDTVRLLLDRFPDIVHLNSCSSHGGTALATALMIDLRAAAYPMTELLLQRGPDSNKLSASGLPMEYGAELFPLEKELQLLPRAAYHGRLELVSRLVEKGADVETDCLKMPLNGTPLLNAVVAGYVGVAEYLLHAGADPNQRTGYNGKTMLQVAETCRADREEMAKVLREYGACESP